MAPALKTKLFVEINASMKETGIQSITNFRKYMFLKRLLDYCTVQLCNARSKFSVSITMPVEMNVWTMINNAMALAQKTQSYVEIDASGIKSIANFADNA